MKLTEIQQDYIKELLNIGVGKAASILNTMLDSHIKLNVPNIQLVTYEEIISEIQSLAEGDFASVDLPFLGSIGGVSKLIFPAQSAIDLISTLVNDSDPSVMDSLKAGTLSEIGNIVLNSVMGVFSNFFNIELTYTVPIYQEGSAKRILNSSLDESQLSILLARTRFSIESMQILGDIVLLMEVGPFGELLKLIDKKSQTA